MSVPGQLLSQGCPSPLCPSAPQRPRRRAGVSSACTSPAAHGGRGWAELAHPGRHRDARARASCHISSAPRPQARYCCSQRCPGGWTRPWAPSQVHPPPAVGPALHDTATAARPPPRADTGHSLVQLTQSGGHACRPCSPPTDTGGRTRRPGGGGGGAVRTEGLLRLRLTRRRRATPGPPADADAGACNSATRSSAAEATRDADGHGVGPSPPPAQAGPGRGRGKNEIRTSCKMPTGWVLFLLILKNNKK